MDLEAAELLALAPMAAVLRPRAILFSHDLYGFDPAEFDALAQSVGAGRLLVEEAEPIDRLVARLREAVSIAGAGGLSEEGRPATRPAERRRDPPYRSGIRWTAVSAPGRKTCSSR